MHENVLLIHGRVIHCDRLGIIFFTEYALHVELDRHRVRSLDLSFLLFSRHKKWIPYKDIRYITTLRILIEFHET